MMASRNHLPPVTGQERVMTTTFLIANLHCPTCVSTVEASLNSLHPKPLSISTSILTHSVTVSHDPSLSVPSIRKALEDEAFEIDSLVYNHDTIDLDLERGSWRGSKGDWRRLGTVVVYLEPGDTRGQGKDKEACFAVWAVSSRKDGDNGEVCFSFP